MDFEKSIGLQMRRRVIDKGFVDRAMERSSAFSRPLQDLINEHTLGRIWCRDALDIKS